MIVKYTMTDANAYSPHLPPKLTSCHLSCKLRLLFLLCLIIQSSSPASHMVLIGCQELACQHHGDARRHIVDSMLQAENARESLTE